MDETILPSGTEETQAPQHSEIEVKAMEMGWRPKEEFDGDESAFIDAGEFVRRQPLFDKISTQGKEIKEVRKALEAFKHHYTAVKETEYNRALEQLKAARQEAVSDGDGDRFAALDAEVKAVETQVDVLKEAKNTPAVPDANPVFESWTKQNTWYTETRYMREFADDVGIRLHKQGLSPEAVLQEVTKAVKKEFPHKFVNPNKEHAPNVSSGNKGAGKNSSFEATLDDTERNIMNTLVRGGHITKEKYLEDLKATRGNR